MSTPTTGIKFNKTTPAAPTGLQNVVFQSDNGIPQQQVTAYDPVMVGDTGAGGVAGNVPAPPSGSAAAGHILRADGTWVASTAVSPMTVIFLINSGTTGTNVALMPPSFRAGSITKCVIMVRQSDASIALTFKLKQNGVDVFTTDPTVSAGATPGAIVTSTLLTSTPLPIASGDVFTIDITSGSSIWQFTAQLE
jgi:hypothetical protein